MVGLTESVGVPRISALSQLRAAQGDGTLSAETLAAIEAGALPPTVVQQADDNIAATQAAPATEVRPLSERVDQAVAAAATPQDTVALSPEAQALTNAAAPPAAPAAPPAAPVQQTAEAEATPTTQTITAQQNPDAAEVALGNAVDVSA